MNNRAIFGAGDKTKLLRHLIEQDFPNVVIIDPTGTLADEIADIIPREHTERTFYFSPDSIASHNVFEDVKDKFKLVQDLCAFFDAMFPAGENTLTRQSSTFVLANALTILLDTHGASFMRVLDFLSDEQFQKQCIESCTNSIAKANWEAIQDWDKAQRKAAFAQVQAKLGTLLLSPIVQSVLVQKCSHFFEHNNILIFNLSREKLGDTVSKLLGTLFITQAKRPVYINDFGFFASDHIASLFSQGGYTVALDFLGELPKTVQQTLLGFDEKYVFHTTPEDADRLKYFFGFYEVKPLIDLNPGEFLPEVDIKPPLVTGRSRAVLRRSIACHSRKSDTR